MKTLNKSVKLPLPLARALEAEASRRNCPESEVIREGIERVTATSAGLDMKTLLADDVGVGEGPADLSSNRRYRFGYGTSRDR